jgi:phosphoribosyl 1,2-cyclic phosphodiesterase
MKVKVAGTGSTGNCYILEHNDRYLILDAGIAPDRVLPMIDYNTDNIDACLITHMHKDHIAYANYYINACIDTVMSRLTAELAGYPIENYFIHTEDSLLRFGGWRILPFDVEHDAPGTRGYLISIGEDTICYITDTGYVKASPQGVTGLIIECNYIDEYLNDLDLSEQQIRLKKFHMSLDRAKSFIGKMDRRKLKNILLVHTSLRHGNTGRMEQEISERVGQDITVTMAKVGKELEW